jgi:hypothetical protein
MLLSPRIRLMEGIGRRIGSALELLDGSWLPSGRPTRSRTSRRKWGAHPIAGLDHLVLVLVFAKLHTWNGRIAGNGQGDETRLTRTARRVSL